MLDEWKEYEEYTFDLSQKPFACSLRLKNVTLQKGLSGISRAMTVVARHGLFEEIPEEPAFPGGFQSARIVSADAFGERPEEEQKGRIRYAKDCVRLWCGDSLEIVPCSAEQVKLKDWLPRYLTVLTEKEKNPLSEEDALKLRKDLVYRITGKNPRKETTDAGTDFAGLLASCAAAGTGMEFGPFHEVIFENEEAEQNDFNKVTYDRIIARALRQGPLKKYYLAAERDYEEDCKKDSKEDGKEDSKDKILYIKGNAAGVRLKSDLLLKITAAYLLADRKKKSEMRLAGPVGQGDGSALDGEQQKKFGMATTGPGGAEDGSAPEEKAKEAAGEGETEYPYRRVVWADITNWMSGKGKIENPDLAALQYHDKPVFEKLTMNMVSKVRPRNVKQGSEYPGYLDRYGWKILEESELEAARQAHPQWIFYEDQGSGQPLKRME